MNIRKTDGVTYRGTHYASITELAKTLNIDPIYVRRYLTKNKNLDFFNSQGVKGRGLCKKQMFRGKEYSSNMAILREYNLTKDLIERLKKRYNLPFETVVDTVVSFVEKYNVPTDQLLNVIPYAIKGSNRFDKLIDFCKHYDVNYCTFMNYQSMYTETGEDRISSRSLCKYLVNDYYILYPQLEEDLPHLVFTKECFEKYMQNVVGV